MKFDKEFDYIIVGSGPSAAGLLWKLISSFTDNDDPWSVCVLERGSNDNDTTTTTSQLHRWCAASHDPNTPQNHIYAGTLLPNSYRVIDVPVGNGLGGTSLINAGLVVPPHPQDFQPHWPSDVAQQIPTAIETIVKTMQQNHTLTTSTTTNNTNTNDIPTALPILNNDNATQFWTQLENHTCCTRVPVTAGPESTTNKNVIVRKTFYQGLVPHTHPNVTVLTGYPVERLLFDSTTTTTNPPLCIGVEVVSCITGKYECIRATKQVILCAGSIETPALLLASGIGRPDDLPTFSSSVVTNFQGAVGHAMRDHILLPRVFLHPPKFQQAQSLNGVRAIAIMQQFTSKDSPMAAANAQISFIDSAAYLDLVPHMMAGALRFQINPHSLRGKGAYINTVLDFTFQLIRFIFRILIRYTPVYWVVRYCVTTVGVFLMNADSIGKITVVAKDRTTPFLRRSQLQLNIALNYLSNPIDLEKFQNAWIASDIAYDTSSMWEVLPGRLVRKGWASNGSLHPRRFEIFARAMVLPYFHWMGTCAMQKRDEETKRKNDHVDDSYVVDAEFRVRGVQNLRICDASVFPTLISAPPALTCAALGVILGEKLIQEASSGTKQKAK